MRKFIFPFSGLIFLGFLSLDVYAGSSCSATNPDINESCSISCDTGESATCYDTSGGNSPSCRCETDPGHYPEGSLKITKYVARKLSSVSPETIERTNVLTVVNTKISPFIFHIKDLCRNVKVAEECTHRLFGGIPGCPHELSGQKNESQKPMKCSGEPICRSIFENQCSAVNSALTAVPPFIVEREPEVVVSEPNWKEIPDYYVGLKQSYRNCTKVQQSITYKHSASLKEGSRISKTKVLETTNGISAKLDFKFGDFGGAGVSTSLSTRVSITNIDEESNELVRAFEETLPLVIPARTKVTLNHFFIQRTVKVPFTGKVTLDSAVSENVSGIKLLSSILKDPKDRTFYFSGYVTDAMVHQTDTTVESKDLTEEECRGNDRIEEIEYIPTRSYNN